MLRNGFILNRRYRIEGITGRGGLSVVYRASDLEANGAVRAVKEIPKNCREIAASARQESKLIKELYEHDKLNFFPNIIQQSETAENLYIVMDYINGNTMSSLLGKGAFEQKLAIEYGKEICTVMQFLHDYGKIYSDMKPDNIMIVNRNSDMTGGINTGRRSGILKLIDFGAVVQMESGIPLQYTPEYAAPEQFRAQRLDKRTDIFNIGATLYHMVTGRKPLPVHDRNNRLRSSAERFVFDSRDRRTDSGMKNIIRKCVDDNPSKRFRTCRELYSALVRSENNSNIRLTLFTAAASLITGALCIFSYGEYRHQKKISYDSLIMAAEKSASYSEKVTAYRSAAGLRPERTEAYFGLINTCKEDLSFTEDEASELLKLMTPNLAELKLSQDYELLAFETGKLYWYYYDYGQEFSSDNTATRMKASVEWFSDAIGDNLKLYSEEKYQMARIYRDIGNFHTEIQKLVVEGDDAGIYRSYWESLSELVSFIDSSQTETEIVLLESYRLVMNSLDAYAFKFAAFVPEDEIRSIYLKIREDTDNLMTTTEKTGQIRRSIRDTYASAEYSLDRAYGGKS